MRGKAAVPLLCAGALALLLSGCSVLGYFMTPDWVEDADLIVVNNSPSVVYAICISHEDETQVVSNADGNALLERGESYGLELDGTGELVTVVLLDRWQRELARSYVEFQGERLFLTLEDGGTMTCTAENAAE